MSATAAALGAVARGVAAYCAGTGGGPRFYTKGSEEFRSFVNEVAAATARYLGGLPAEESSLRIAVLRRFWGLLHALAKPVADADTLNTPVAIVKLLERAATLQNGGRADIVLLHSPELNYFEHSRNRFRAIYRQLQESIEGLPSFPEHLCMIGLPFSQARRYLTNICLFHEIGHFLAEDRQPLRKVENLIREVVAPMTNEPEAASWVADRLRAWAEELFCDLFAARWIGPAYTFAFAHVMELLGMLDPSEIRQFSDSHPAVGFRLGLQRRRLEKDGWWDAIRGIEGRGRGSSPYFELIGTVPVGASDYEFRGPQGQGLPMLLTAFSQVASDVEDLLDRGFPLDRRRAPEIFRDRWPAAKACLENAIVPSAAFEDVGREDQGIVALVNAAAYFQVSQVSALEKKLEPQPGASKLDHLGRCLAKVEEWSLTAVENASYAGAGAP